MMRRLPTAFLVAILVSGPLVWLAVWLRSQPPEKVPSLTITTNDIEMERGETVYIALARLRRDAASARDRALETDMLRRRLAHVCPEAFPLASIATRPLTNTMPQRLSPDDLLRYNKCAEASGIAR